VHRAGQVAVGLPRIDRELPRGLAANAVAILPAVAQQTNSYETFTSTVAATAAENLEFVGVLVDGEGRAVRAVTGDLPLLR
jgi:hypothetical protein